MNGGDDGTDRNAGQGSGDRPEVPITGTSARPLPEEPEDDTPMAGEHDGSGPPFYMLLCVNVGATSDEIRRAYYRQAKVWHPDKNLSRRAEATERFKQIGEAFETLSDPSKRAEYDIEMSVTAEPEEEVATNESGARGSDQPAAPDDGADDQPAPSSRTNQVTVELTAKERLQALRSRLASRQKMRLNTKQPRPAAYL